MDREPRILLADDEEDYCHTTREVLENRGLKVKTFTSSSEALAELKHTDYDLIMTDYSMKGMGGVEFIREVRFIKPFQRIMVVSGFPTQYAQIRAFKAGALYYVSKPYDIDFLVMMITEALEENMSSCGSMLISFEELIQLFVLGEKTVLLKIASDGKEGRIYFKKGVIIHAEYSNQVGIEAFSRILSMKMAVFKTESYKGTVRQTVDLDLRSLIIVKNV